MIRLFNKIGQTIEFPPTHHGWGNALQGIRAFRDPIMARTTIRSDLSRVHRFVSGQIGQSTDPAIYGNGEYWATPMQVLDRGVGDCEDHAILKWAILNGMGYPPQSFSIAAVIDKRRGDGHAVLVYMGGNQNIVLDNQIADIYSDQAVGWYDPRYAYGYGKNWVF